jgi:BMFP domain-containing protein YqiC
LFQVYDEGSSSTPQLETWVPLEVSRLRKVVVEAVVKTRQIIQQSVADGKVATAEAEEESRALRKTVRNLEARLQETEAELAAVRRKAREEFRTLNAKVWDLEARLVGAEVDQQMMRAFQRWTGEVQSSKW